MKILIILLISFYCQLSFANVTFTAVQQIVMTDKSCDELNFHAQSILNWNESKTNNKNSIPECYCSSKSCQMDVAAISPYPVTALTNYNNLFTMNSAYSGPNCFNAALVMSETLPHITFTHPYEMSAILESSLCREKDILEPLFPGDVLVVRNQVNEFFEIHAGIYINDTLSFSKYGESNAMPYSYGLDVTKVYGVLDEDCRRIQGIPSPQDTCYKKPFVNFFSCQPFYSYISQIFNQPGGIIESVRAVYADVSLYDIKISNIALKGYKISPLELKQYQERLLELYKQSEIVGSNTSLNTANKELAHLMRFRIFSLFEQTRRIAARMGEKNLTGHQLKKPN